LLRASPKTPTQARKAYEAIAQSKGSDGKVRTPEQAAQLFLDAVDKANNTKGKTVRDVLLESGII